jgi:hypothetical protein
MMMMMLMMMNLHARLNEYPAVVLACYSLVKSIHLVPHWVTISIAIVIKKSIINLVVDKHPTAF